MDKLKKIIILVVSFYFLAVSLIIYSFLSPNLSEKECKQIAINFDKLKIGITKTEVIKLIGEESTDKIYPYAGVISPEQKTQWEIWLLCKQQDYQWQMIAFDMETDELIKILIDDPNTIGF